MSLKTHVITSLVSIGAGAAGAWYLLPPKVRVETQVKEVVRTVTIRDTKRVRVTTKPDGTRIEEHSETRSDTSSKTDLDARSISQPHPRWNVSLLGGANLQLNPVFGVQVNYRLIGPFTVGAFALGSPAASFWAAGIQAGVTF